MNYFFGLTMGWLITGLVFTYLPDGKIYTMDKMKTACEVNIPHDYKCVMQFVPEKK